MCIWAHSHYESSKIRKNDIYGLLFIFSYFVECCVLSSLTDFHQLAVWINFGLLNSCLKVIIIASIFFFDRVQSNEFIVFNQNVIKNVYLWLNWAFLIFRFIFLVRYHKDIYRSLFANNVSRWPFTCQPHKMVKHTQTIRWQKSSILDVWQGSKQAWAPQSTFSYFSELETKNKMNQTKSHV